MNHAGLGKWDASKADELTLSSSCLVVNNPGLSINISLMRGEIVESQTRYLISHFLSVLPPCSTTERIKPESGPLYTLLQACSHSESNHGQAPVMKVRPPQLVGGWQGTV